MFVDLGCLLSILVVLLRDCLFSVGLCFIRLVADGWFTVARCCFVLFDILFVVCLVF